MLMKQAQFLATLSLLACACTMSSEPPAESVTTKHGDAEVASERLVDDSIRGEIYRSADLVAIFELDANGVGVLEDLVAKETISLEFDVNGELDLTKINLNVHTAWVMTIAPDDASAEEIPYLECSGAAGEIDGEYCAVGGCWDDGWACGASICSDGSWSIHCSR